MRDIQRPDAVFFDWDGTLIDSFSFLNDAHAHVLQELGFPPFKDGEFKDYFGKPREMLYKKIYKDKADRAKELFGCYVSENLNRIRTIEGSSEFIEALHKRDIPMGVVTNKHGDFVSKEIEHLGWNHFFPTLIGAGDAHSDKPSGAPLFLALERAGLCHESHNIWFIGDTENDLSCAREVGCHGLFLTGHDDTVRLIEEFSPLISFKDYKELQEILVAI